MELGLLAMAAGSAHSTEGDRERGVANREAEEASEGGEELGVHIREARARPRGRERAFVAAHGEHVPDTQRPLGHFSEHVEGDGVVGVGSVFRLVMSRIGPRSQKQS